MHLHDKLSPQQDGCSSCAEYLFAVSCTSLSLSAKTKEECAEFLSCSMASAHRPRSNWRRGRRRGWWPSPGGCRGGGWGGRELRRRRRPSPSNRNTPLRSGRLGRRRKPLAGVAYQDYRAFFHRDLAHMLRCCAL
jgi:hypothetical protein